MPKGIEAPEITKYCGGAEALNFMSPHTPGETFLLGEQDFCWQYSALISVVVKAKGERREH